MSNFLKNFALGIVYIVILPFILLGTVLVGLYGLMGNLVLSIKGIIRFFKGERFLERPQEDEETALIMKKQKDALLNPEPKEAAAPAPAPAPSNVYVQNNYYQAPNKGADPTMGAIGNNGPIEGSASWNNPALNNPSPSHLVNPNPASLNNPANPALETAKSQPDPVKELVSSSPDDEGGNK